MIRRKLSLLLPLLLSVFFFAQAQENSPYTRYGIGEIRSENFAATRGFGEVYSAYNNPSDFTVANPASLGYLNRTSFQFGGLGSASWIKTNSGKSFSGDGSLDYLSLGFPLVKKYWGAALGMSQLCRANYFLIQEEQSVGQFSQQINTFKGSGGFNQVYLANGVKFKNFSVGLKVSYLFGTINYSNTLEFDDTLNAYNTRKQEARTLNDLSWNAGLQYSVPVKIKVHGILKKFQLCFGLDGNLGTNINSSRNLLFERFVYNDLGDGTLFVNVKDTVYAVNGEKGEITFPMRINGSVLLRSENKFMAGAQFQYGKWSDYRSFGEQDSTANNWKLSIGGEWTPNSESLDSYFSLVRYRLGLYYGTNYLRFSGNDFNRYGVTLGFGLPVRGGHLMNIAFNLGQSGNLKNNLERQTYLQGTIGFSLSDFWFQKRKYD